MDDDYRVLLLAPTRRDREATQELLQRAGISSIHCDGARSLTAVIQRQVGHMALLLDDLLDIARITQGKLALKKTRVALTEVVDSAVETARPLIDSKRHHLTITLPPEDLHFEADPLRLSQVLSNLLTNAAKYTDAEGHIALSGSVQNGTLTLSVRDDGIGLAPEALIRIFEMFSQVESASARTEGGLGIGLALVKGLSELHGGAIDARSDGPGHGSEFTLSLPLADAPLVMPAEADGAAAAGAARRVMVADDNQDAADALALLLELNGHEVRVARGGRAALSRAQTFRPEVALIDIGMPDLNGAGSGRRAIDAIDRAAGRGRSQSPPRPPQAASLPESSPARSRASRRDNRRLP